jgi:hypothetical protein
MKLIYAQLWLRKFIHYNINKYDDGIFNNKLNRAVINLSHRVFKSHSIRGHNTRQEIRQQLQKFCEVELEKYDKKWIVKSPNHGYVKSVHPSIFSRIINAIKRLIIGRKEVK